MPDQPGSRGVASAHGRRGMTKTWQNVNCTFQTQNTENGFGNSQYTITGNPNRMIRYAPVNQVRAPNQVHFDEARAVCYLQPGSPSYDDIMSEGDDTKITIHSVLGESIVLKTPGRFVNATRTPATGWFVFDCFNNDGVLSRIHVGHAIINLTLT
jgi:hypothetical protein